MSSSSHQVVLKLQSNEYSEDILFFRTDWFDLLAIQVTLNSLLQYHSLKASILAFFTVEFAHRYITTGKTIALAIWTFVGKVMSLLSNMLSRFVCHSFPSKEHVSFNFMAAVTVYSDLILEPKKIKFVTVSTFSPSIFHEVVGLDAIILVLWTLSFKPDFSLASFTLIRSSLVPLCFIPLEWYHLHIRGCWYFSQ